MSRRIAWFGLVLLCFFQVKAEDLNYYFCGGYVGEDDFYFNLFMQELVDKPEYFPFLRTYEPFYKSNLKAQKPERNENIEAWQAYFELSYEQTAYLVFQASEKEIRNSLKGQNNNRELSFLDNQFVQKHKQALLYLAYAKYLEPYMAMKNEYYWYSKKEFTVEDLPYEEVMEVLKKSWNAEKDKELKLRYGYQMVRLAHYKGNYKDAVAYFDQYVEVLNHQTIMYYYALDQRGGAWRALGKYLEANADFFRFFTHTKNRKEQAYQSIKVTQELDFQTLLQAAQTQQERNDVYLLLGFNDFNNPLASAYDILAESPNAIQAKVLVARAINQIEREYLPLSYYFYGADKDVYLKNNPDKRIPFALDENYQDFLEEAIALCKSQVENDGVEDRDFWSFALSYLYLLNKEYDRAQSNLVAIEKPEHSLYLIQRKRLEILIDVLKQDELTDDFLLSRLPVLKELFTYKNTSDWGYNYQNTTGDFLKDVIANRLFLQGEYAKAFLMQNRINHIEMNPDWRLLDDLNQFIHKKNKNEFENYLLQSAVPRSYHLGEDNKAKAADFDYGTYLAQARGSRFLAEFKLDQALQEFEKVPDGFVLPHYTADEEGYNFDGYSRIPLAVFGVKSDGDFTPRSVLDVTYVTEFDFLKENMNKRQLTTALVQLKEIAAQKGDRAAKANFLLGNFYYNTTSMGYYRHLLKFDLNNRNSAKYSLSNYWYREYRLDWETDYLTRFYYKYYEGQVGYEDDFELPESFYRNGLNQTQDKELKARLLFAAAQAEQGRFHQNGEFAFIEENKDVNRYSNEYRQQLRDYKVKNYRSYFEELSKNYATTAYFKEIKSRCLYLDYYTTRF